MHVLDNAAWHALNGPHAALAEREGRAMRYEPDVSPFAAVDRLDADAWADLATLAGPGGLAVLFRPGAIDPPGGWRLLGGGTGEQMVLDASVADVDEPPPGTRPLTTADVPTMMELIHLTEPGPFRQRTIELGNYHGVFHGDDLVAMAGQRLQVPGYTEISAVCTHPEARRRGYAAAMTMLVARLIRAAGSVPMLHVASTNTSALRVYEALGFRVRQQVAFAVFAAPGAAAESTS